MNTLLQKAQQDKINSDVAAFLSVGGVIRELAGYGMRTEAYDPITVHRREKAKKIRAPATKKSMLAAQARKTLKTSKKVYFYIRDGRFSVRSREVTGSKLITIFTSLDQVNGFNFGRVIDDNMEGLI